MDTKESLYREICQHPEEDTPRLAYADLLYETGEVDRAEYIKAQIEMRSYGYPCPNTDRVKELAFLIYETEKAHPEREKVSCPKCEHVLHRKWDWECPVCYGTGDLFYGWSYPPPVDIHHHLQKRKVNWDRGFINSVTCRLDEFGTETDIIEGSKWGYLKYAEDFILSEWTKSILQYYPITSFIFTDRTPIATSIGTYEWMYSTIVPLSEAGYMLPFAMFHLLTKGNHKEGLHYSTRQAALDHLYTEVATLARQTVWGLK